MPKELEKACHELILVYAAAVSIVVAPKVPFTMLIMPISYTTPIDESQIHVGMIANLGRVFGFTLSDAAAEVIVSGYIVKARVSSILRSSPVISIVEHPIYKETKIIRLAVATIEALGWFVADDFYRMSNGEEPVNIDIANITENVKELKEVLENLRSSKKG